MLMQRSSAFTRVAGDRCWLRNDGQPFDTRVASTNRMILDEIRSMTDPLLLLEWVPGTGPSADSLRAWCSSQGRAFTHIVLYAKAGELKRRKMKRNGDEDISSPDTGHYARIRDALVIDTMEYSETDMLKRVLERLIEDKVLQS